jgi:hypothetical protein
LKKSLENSDYTPAYHRQGLNIDDSDKITTKKSVSLKQNLWNQEFLGKHLQFCDGRVSLAEADGPGFESFRIAVLSTVT